MSEDRPLSTEDLARASSNDLRGHHEESVVNRDTVVDRPESVAAARDQTSDNAGSTTKNRATMSPDNRSPLFAEQDANTLRKRWSDVQASFVDEPRKAVEQADALVA